MRVVLRWVFDDGSNLHRMTNAINDLIEEVDHELQLPDVILGFSLVPANERSTGGARYILVCQVGFGDPR